MFKRRYRSLLLTCFKNNVPLIHIALVESLFSHLFFLEILRFFHPYKVISFIFSCILFLKIQDILYLLPCHGLLKTQAENVGTLYFYQNFCYFRQGQQYSFRLVAII